MFGRDQFGNISLEEADEDQLDLSSEIKKFIDKTRPKNKKKKQKKEIASDNLYKFLNAREIVLNGFKSKIFSIKSKGSCLLNSKLKY